MRRDTALSLAVFLPVITMFLAIGIGKGSGLPLFDAMGIAAVIIAAWWAAAPTAALLRRLRR